MNGLFTLFAWYLELFAIGLLCFPVISKLLPELSDRGYSFARVLGLLIWGYSFWLLTTFGILSNDFGGALIGILVLIVIDWKILQKDGVQTVSKWLSTNWKTVLFSEAVFLAAFIFIFFLRASDPVISGTEKPMELAFINAIQEAPAFPPPDPWLSGYSISYYYFGYIMVALLGRLSGATGGVSFNLAIMTWFAMTAQAAFGLLFTLLSRWWNSRYAGDGPSNGAPRMRSWALLGAFFILIVSNWAGLLEVMHSGGLFWERNSQGQLESDFWTWLEIKELDQPPVEPFTGIPERNGGIWWWRASRILQDFDMQGNEKEIIDEFPFFSFYLADLHPHVLSMPFILLALSISANLFYSRHRFPPAGDFSPESKGSPDRNIYSWHSIKKMSSGVGQTNFWFAAWMFGSLAFINIWDFPVNVAVFAGIYALGRAHQSGWHKNVLLDFIWMGLALGIAGVLFYLPYYVGFSSQAGGILPSLSFYTRGVYFWIMFAPLLVPLIAWLLYSSLIYIDIKYFFKGLKISALIVINLWLFSYLLGGLFASGIQAARLFSTVLGSSSGTAASGRLGDLSQLFSGLHGTNDAAFLLLGSLGRRFLQPGTWLTLLIMLAFCAAIIIHKADQRDLKIDDVSTRDGENKPGLSLPSPHEFTVILILVGIALTLVPEFFYLRDQFGWRMNTIFKFYFQAWIVWGISAAYGFTILWIELKRIPGMLIKTGMLLSLAAGLLYPYFAVYNRLDHLTLSSLKIDGTEYIADYNRAEYNAVKWLKESPYGVITEAIGGSYSSFGRIATQSGYPNVLGWPGHESQWRGGSEEMGSREQDIETLYRTSDWETARSILEKYQVRYVYLGDLERSTYRAIEKKFSDNLKAVFQEDDVIIYEVPLFQADIHIQ